MSVAICIEEYQDQEHIKANGNNHPNFWAGEYYKHR